MMNSNSVTYYKPKPGKFVFVMLFFWHPHAENPTRLVAFVCSLALDPTFGLSSGCLSSGWSFITVVFYQCGLISGWSLIGVAFHQGFHYFSNVNCFHFFSHHRPTCLATFIGSHLEFGQWKWPTVSSSSTTALSTATGWPSMKILM